MERYTKETLPQLLSRTISVLLLVSWKRQTDKYNILLLLIKNQNTFPYPKNQMKSKPRTSDAIHYQGREINTKKNENKLFSFFVSFTFLIFNVSRINPEKWRCLIFILIWKD